MFYIVITFTGMNNKLNTFSQNWYKITGTVFIVNVNKVLNENITL
jgi:hypothetical protein